MQELLPCPFCGGEATISNNNLSSVSCPTQHCRGHKSGVFRYSSIELIAAWNRRADDADRADLVARCAELEAIVTAKGLEALIVDNARLVAQVPSENVLNTIKVLAYEMSKTMIGMADRFPEGHVRANVAKLDEVFGMGGKSRKGDRRQ